MAHPILGLLFTGLIIRTAIAAVVIVAILAHAAIIDGGLVRTHHHQNQLSDEGYGARTSLHTGQSP